MSFFDPPHVKIINWSPMHFQASRAFWGRSLEEALLRYDVPPAMHKIFRTAVVGTLAQMAAKENVGDWTATNLLMIREYTSNAINLTPAQIRPKLSVVMQAVGGWGVRIEVAAQLKLRHRLLSCCLARCQRDLYSNRASRDWLFCLDGSGR